VDTAQALPGKTTRLGRSLQEAESADPLDYDALQKQMERSGKLIASLPWPEGQSRRWPALLARLNEAMERLQQQSHALEKHQAQYTGNVQAAIENLRNQLDANHTREADRALHTARRNLTSLPPNKRQQFEHALKPLTARLHEVHDWQGFAVEPKKIGLCAAMKALIGQQEDAEMLALKIQSLQDEWKQIGPLPHAREHALWLEFKAAADEAWKPCKAAFSAQAKLQRENFKRRMGLVKQLTSYEAKMTWPGKAVDMNQTGGQETPSVPDWHKVQATLDAARAAFGAIHPVNPKGERNSQRAFREICDRIYHHIKEEYGRNIAHKTELVTRAQGLTTAVDLPTAIETAKKMQREWKTVGLTPVGVDRKLWKEFRAACDAVFTRLDAQRTQNRAELDAQVKQAEGLQDQARALLESKDEEEALGLGQKLAEL
ncbi:MAG: DUF349 domain-containing protein, partial [Lysobacterales bacterium]